MGRLDFDSSAVEPSSGEYPRPPEGWHKAKIVKSDVDESKFDDEGLKIYNAWFELIDLAPMKAFSNIRFVNPDLDKQKTGQGILSSLCRACGRIGIVAEPEELLECELMIKIKYNGQYTNVVAYEAIKAPRTNAGKPIETQEDATQAAFGEDDIMGADSVF